MRAGMRGLTVLIPVLDEAEAIGRVIDEVVSAGVPRENILVVDGGSRDGTVEIARARGVRVVRQEGRGKAMAVKTGLRHVSTPYVLVMDGDYTYPAEYIPVLYRVLVEGGYDLVIGARVPERGAQSLVYRVGNALLTRLFNLLFGTRLSDVLSGMYAARTRRLRELGFEMQGFSIESEIAAHVASTTGRIAEVPIRYRRRLGRKKLRVLHGLSIARDMVRLAWRYNPAFLIFLLGGLLLAPGLGLGGWVAYMYLAHGVKHYVKGLAAVVLSSTGLASLLLAVMALYLKRAEMRLQRRLEELAERLNRLLEERVDEGGEGPGEPPSPLPEQPPGQVAEVAALQDPQPAVGGVAEREEGGAREPVEPQDPGQGSQRRGHGGSPA
ncbi:glycosyltransferase family 2 protein [Pyrodictium occultum]|uniref:glycosyltransferase family 2 protein n=1 Tax=Pyrodictium occultum TaxID=2309 RepID=UPI001F165E0C|nr:glycosyltransferase family 2 protein [Pyrodictium occultum]